VYFAGLYVCLLGGTLLLSILIFAARSLLDLSEEADLSRGAWHRLSGALVAWAGVIVGGIFLGRIAFDMEWTRAVLYAITTVNTSGLVLPPPGILAAAYVAVAVPTHAVLLGLVSLEMTRPYIRYLREQRSGNRRDGLPPTTSPATPPARPAAPNDGPCSPGPRDGVDGACTRVARNDNATGGAENHKQVECNGGVLDDVGIEATKDLR